MNPSKSWLLLGGLVLAGYLIYLLQPILAPFLVAATLAYLGDPAADKLERWGMSRTWAVVVVFSALTLLLVLLLFLLIPLLGRQLSYLLGRLPAILAWLEGVALPWLELRFGFDAAAFDFGDLRTRLAGNWQQAGDVVRLVIAQTTRSSLALLAALANLALIPVVTFYLLRDWDVMLARIHALLPRRSAPTAVQLARECDSVLAAFVRGQLLVMIALGAIYSLGLWAVGLQLALLIGIIAGIANVVPYLGFIVGIAAATVAAFFQFHDWQHLVLVWGVFMIGQVLESTVLTPWLVGDRIGLHPVAVIFAVLAGGQLFGFVGILIALPMAAVVMVLLRHAHHLYLRSAFYDEPPPA
jgi:predicted PurR-regulated permease PerM